MNNKTNTELLPCPFCGSEAHLYESQDGYWYVACIECINQTTHFFNGKDVVIERWNRRYDHAAAELRWIPVSERLPEDGTDNDEWTYYFILTNRGYAFATYHKGAHGLQWYDDPEMDGCLDNEDLIAIAWMPIPSYTNPADPDAGKVDEEGV